ncbi:MAG: SRPBCC family protein [Pseudomonadota bacterium]
MKFSTNEDIAAPIDVVFRALCDFEQFERAALRRGAEIRRLDSMAALGVGMRWQANFSLRGKEREVQIELTSFDPPEQLLFDSVSPNMLGHAALELTALSKDKTRLKVGFEVKPLNLSSKLLVQSLRLAKYTLTKRYKKRVADYARSLEARHRGAT